ncbi:MAG: hypothetical protein D6785_13505 [Planctomycetota bacterium]|nr:MAG: hypothetical protein D6785_13505 [Planctomycetota bacterium]
MFQKRIGFVILFVCLMNPFSSLSLKGQETQAKEKKYKFKALQHKKGMKFVVEEKGETVQQVSMGALKSYQERKEKEERKYVVEILEVEKKIPRKVHLLVDTWKKEMIISQMKKVLVEKKRNLKVEKKKIEILYDKEGSHPKFQYLGGGKLSREAFFVLRRKFGKSSISKENKLFPQKPLHEGETWEIDPKVVLEALQISDSDIAKEKIKAKGKIQKFYRKKDSLFADFEIHIQVPLQKLGKLKVSKGTMDFISKGRTCWDGTSPEQSITVEMVMRAVKEDRSMKAVFEMKMHETRTVKEIK